MIETGSILLIGMTIGLFGSLVMFASDLLLRFTAEKLVVNDDTESYSIVMRDLPTNRDQLFDTHFSNTLCTVGALFYAVAFAILPLTATTEIGFYLLFVVAVLLAFALIYSATHHSYLPHQSFVSSNTIGSAFAKLISNSTSCSRVVLIPLYVGTIVLALVILTKQTVFPSWFMLFTPFSTSLIGFIWKYIPLHFSKTILNGWNQMVFALMFFAMLVWCLS